MKLSPYHFMAEKEKRLVKQIMRKKEHRRHIIKKVLMWIVQILIVLALAFGVSYEFFGSITMQEASMEPTIAAGERILINKLTYQITSPARDDVIVYRKSDDPRSAMTVKRVIGLPGETVQIKDGMILINGETYIEQNKFPKIDNAGLAESPVKLGGGEYFVLGDNRNNSEDSRYSEVGCVQKQNIIGKLWFVTAPADSFGFLKE